MISIYVCLGHQVVSEGGSDPCRLGKIPPYIETSVVFVIDVYRFHTHGIKWFFVYTLTSVVKMTIIAFPIDQYLYTSVTIV